MTEYDKADGGQDLGAWAEATLPAGQSSLLVTMPSGAVIPVWNERERLELTGMVERYQNDNLMINVSDQQDLDRMLAMELLIHRWQWFLLQGVDYNGGPFDEAVLKRDVKEWGLEVRMLKKQIGIDKVARDKQRGEGSLAAYLANLTEKAKRFGVHREQQLDKALELINELIGFVTFHRNLDDDEKAEMHATADDVVEWIWERLRPEFEEIDAHFRANDHRYWVRTL